MDQEVGQYQSQVKNEIEIKIFNLFKFGMQQQSLQMGKDTSNSCFTLDFSYNTLLTLTRLPFPTVA